LSEPVVADGAEVVRLRHRSEFLAAARGARVHREPFVLQGLPRGEDDRAGKIGLGLTVTKKLGGAVVRNRARRRLREALRLTLPGAARPGADYVVVARSAALSVSFARLQSELVAAFEQMASRLERGRR
jgi:ribonuclease P protein component